MSQYQEKYIAKADVNLEAVLCQHTCANLQVSNPAPKTEPCGDTREGSSQNLAGMSS